LDVICGQHPAEKGIHHGGAEGTEEKVPMKKWAAQASQSVGGSFALDLWY
jgi:hypothetical protein